MPTSPPPVDPMASSSGQASHEPLFSRNLGWIIVLALTAAVVVFGLILAFQGLRISEVEQTQTRREHQLTNELGDVAEGLLALQIQAWTLMGTGSTEDFNAFTKQQTQLKETLTHLRTPQDFPELRRQRLEKLPQQTESYISEIVEAIQLRRAGKVGESIALLQRSRTTGQSLEVTVKTLQEDAQDAVRDRQRFLETTRVGLRAKVIVHSVLLCLLLVVTYLVLRTERLYQQKREKQLQREKQHLKELTEQDGLTGLQNRRAFDDRLRMEWRRARRYGVPLSILMLDVDHFGKFNKDFGVQTGDDVLRHLAGALAQTARLTDTIARYGGEEFVILLPHTTCEEALIVGNRLRAILAHHDWPKRRVTASIGLATMNNEIKDADALVRAADDAMRFAKAHGRDRVIHWEHVQPVGTTS